MAGRILLPKNIDVVVASFGGVGSTFLLRHLSRFLRTNDLHDRDGFKHAPFPPIPRKESVKFVYMFGDPRLAALSIFRRRIHNHHSMKMQKLKIFKKGASIPKEMSLTTYAGQGKDQFQFRRHFFNWYEKYLSTQPTLFLRYETLFENVRILQSFLQLPESFVTTFPQKKERASSLQQIEADLAKDLEELYGSFALELESLADIEIRQKKGAFFRYWPYFKGPYPLAMIRYDMLYQLEIRAPAVHKLLKDFFTG